MSTTFETPRGLDKLTPDEERLMQSMMDDEPEPARSAPEAVPEPEEVTIELPADVSVATVEPDLDDDGVPAKKKTVNERIKALTDARKAAEKLADEREARAALAENALATEKAVTQERLRLLLAAASAPVQTTPAPIHEVAEEPLPDKNTDPIGYFEALTGRQAKQIETARAIAQGAQDALAQQQRIQDFQRWGQQQELSFEAQEPTYRAAMDFLKKSRHEELEAIGVTDPNERERIIGTDVNAIAIKGRQDNVNFASRLYAAAVKRGFQKAAPIEVVVPTASIIPPLDAEVVPVATTRAARIEEGRENSMTLSGVGAAPPTRMTPDQIGSMDDKAFETLYAKVKDNPAMMRQIFGS